MLFRNQTTSFPSFPQPDGEKSHLKNLLVTSVRWYTALDRRPIILGS
jgi:hypothetical protein